MQIETSIRRKRVVASLAFGLLTLVALISSSFAQEPPLDVTSVGKLPARDPNAIAVNGWLLYPALRIYSLYSDNIFLSSLRPLSVPGIGITPSMTAEWSNGIHTTTLYGNIDRQAFPTQNEINTLDGRAGFTQKYEAMRDLIFTVNGNFNHQTWSTGLQNSLQTPAATPTTIVLPNGNTVLPNGTIVSPSGQVVGQTSPTTTGSNVQVAVNPFNQYSGTFSIDKIFNRGIVSLSETVSRNEYESQVVFRNYNRRQFTEHASFWLGPLFYAYSDGSIGTVETDGTSGSTTAYRVLGGFGTRQFGLWRGSLYFGHQGSQSNTATSGVTNNVTAGGDIYGGTIAYYPIPQWTLTGTVDRITNISSQASATNLALNLPSFSPIQVPLTASSRSTSASLLSSYEISQQWFASALLGYLRIEYVGSSRVDTSWVANATLRYDIWKNMSLAWEYRYRSVISNALFATVNSNTFVMGTTYRF